MTDKEAMEFLKLDKAGHEAADVSDDTKPYWDCVIKALDVAIKALDNHSKAELDCKGLLNDWKKQRNYNYRRWYTNE